MFYLKKKKIYIYIIYIYIYIYIYIALKRELAPVRLISKHLCNAHHTYIWHTCTNTLDDLTRPSGVPCHGIWPVLTLMWYNHIVK